MPWPLIVPPVMADAVVEWVRAGGTLVTESELDAWMSAVGSLRLVLGTRLDVSEDMVAPDPEDPMAPEYALYELLGQLQYLMIEVLASQLPDEGRPEGSL